MSGFLSEALSIPLDQAWSDMTFPAYRQTLSHLGPKNATIAPSAAARGARVQGRPVGLALATLIPGEEDAAELLSLYVLPDCRGRGLATALLADLEEDLVCRGVARLVGTYMTGRPTRAALERVLAKRGFSPPALRSVAVRFTPEEAARTAWYRRAKLPADSEVFSWTELTAKEREQLRRSQANQNWIHPDLEPWRFDQQCDEVSSVGLRKAGEVVGWVINHRIAPDMVRFTISFVRSDLAKRGGIFPLYVASLERLRGSGVMCTFVTAAHFERMNRFVLKRCAPFISFCGATHGVSKELSER